MKKLLLVLSLFSFLFAEETETAMQESLPTAEIALKKEPSINNLLTTRKLFPYVSAGAFLIIPQGGLGVKYFFNNTSALDLQGGATVDLHGAYVYFGSLEFQYYFSQKTNPNPISKLYLGSGLALSYDKNFYRLKSKYMPMPKLSIGVQFYQPTTQRPNVFINLSTSMYLFPALNIGCLF